MKFRTICRRAPVRVLLLIVVLLGADVAAFALLPMHTLCPEVSSVSVQEPQALAILFNGFSQGHTGINRETERRLRYGLSRLHGNRGARLLVVGGHRPDIGVDGARLMEAFLRAQDVPDRQIMVEDQSRDSLGNLEGIRRMAREAGLESVGVVSSPFHLLRIRALKMPAAEGFFFFPYPPEHCDPPLNRQELWWSAHSNLAAWVADVLLPEAVYKTVVIWIRTHTEF